MTLKAAARRADRVVVSSRQEHADALEFGIASEKLRLIPMGFDFDTPQPVRQNGDGETLRILFVGRIARVRRVELILQAVHLLSGPCHLTVVGGEETTSSVESGGYLKQLKALCRTLGIENRVTFTGPKKPEALAAQYRNADVFVYPSLYENFGQPVLEAAAHGLPVIATPVGVAGEIVREGETGFLVSGDAGAIAERLRILSDAPTRARFGEEMLRNVRKQFDWREIIERYLELYRGL